MIHGSILTRGSIIQEPFFFWTEAEGIANVASLDFASKCMALLRALKLLEITQGFTVGK